MSASALVRKAAVGLTCAAAVAAPAIVNQAPVANASSPFLAATGTKVPAGWAVFQTGSAAMNSSSTVWEAGPTGARKALLTLPYGSELTDVSGDGHRVLVETYRNSGLRIYDLYTHRITDVPGLQASAARFTNPSGVNLYAQKLVSGKAVGWVRVDFAGHVGARFTRENPVPTANGNSVFYATSKGVTQASNATGAVQHNYANPTGYTDCHPSRAWATASVVAFCTRKGGTRNDVFYATGGRWVNLTGAIRDSYTFGFSDAWKAPSGLVAQYMPMCGPTTGVLWAGGKEKKLGFDLLAGVTGNTAWGMRNANCGVTRPTVAAINLATQQYRALYTPPAGQTVVNLVLNDQY